MVTIESMVVSMESIRSISISIVSIRISFSISRPLAKTLGRSGYIRGSSRVSCNSCLRNNEIRNSILCPRIEGNNKDR